MFELLWFAVGLIIGAPIGMMVTAMFVVARQADELGPAECLNECEECCPRD
jgi:hypothetical protein